MFKASTLFFILFSTSCNACLSQTFKSVLFEDSKGFHEDIYSLGPYMQLMGENIVAELCQYDMSDLLEFQTKDRLNVVFYSPRRDGQYGFYRKDLRTIYIDISGDLDWVYWTFRHEVFHYLYSSNDFLYEWPSQEYRELGNEIRSPSDVLLFKNGFVTEYAGTNEEEDQAETYACLFHEECRNEIPKHPEIVVKANIIATHFIDYPSRSNH